MPKRNATRLTQTFVNGASSKGKTRVRFWDANVPGLVLTVTASGNKGFYCVYRDQEGRQREPLVGDARAVTLDQARTAVMKLLSASRLSGADPIQEKRAVRQAAQERRDRTLNGLWQTYLADFQIRRAKSRNDLEAGYFRRHIQPRFGDRQVNTLTTPEIAELVRILAASSGHAAANTTLEVMRRMLRFTVDIGWITVNPALPIQAYAKRSRERVATEYELGSLWRTLTALTAAGRSIARRSG
jgi:Arm DNA-binding domain